MPAISKIRLTNVVYEEGNKRYNDEVFHFDGHNGAIVLENGGGKTVFIHTVLQAVFPHANLGNRKIKETLQLENAPAHIGIEWITNENPRRYATTCVSLFLTKDGLDSFRYVFAYDGDSPDRLEKIPFVRETTGGKRAADRGEIMEYYSSMKSKSMYAATFSTITAFREYIEEQHHIIANEWDNIVSINGDEGGIDKFFESCRTTNDLYDRLLIPTVEGSISGHEAGMFAEMFEKQRAGFHMYKKLSESMKENKLIQEELDKYVNVYALYTEKQASYLTSKSHAKGLWNLLQQQLMEVEKEQAANQTSFNEWEKAQEEQEWKQASFQIFREEQTKEKLEEEHTMISAAYAEAEDRLESTEKDYHSLKYASVKKKLKSYQERLNLVEEELALREKDEALTDLEARMDESNRALKGYFVEQQENLEKVIQGLHVEIQPLQDKRSKLKEQAKQQEKQVNEHKISRGKLEQKIESQNERTAKLKQEILGNPEQEDVQREMDKWLKRNQFLDEEIIRLRQKEKENYKQIGTLEEEKDSLTDERQDAHIELSSRQESETRIKEAHDHLIVELAVIRTKWAAVSNLYMRENTIYEELLDYFNKLSREQETLLQKERVALRLVDDYENQDMFFGDAYLNEQLSNWKNQFDYLVSGVEYFQGLDEKLKHRYRSFPLWPLTLITTKQSQAGLLERLEMLDDRIQIPIHVLTLEEAKTLEETSDYHSWIAPKHWNQNLEQQAFFSWQEDLQEHARAITENRKEKEKEITKLAIIRKEFEKFFMDFPKDFRDQLTKDIRQFEERITAIGEQLKKNRERSRAVSNEQLSIRNDIQVFLDEMNGLGIKITKAIDYLATEKQLMVDRNQLESTTNHLEHLEKELRLTKRQRQRYESDIEDLLREKSDAENDIKWLTTNEDYQDVQQVKALFTGEEKSVISHRRKKLELAINKIQSSYSELIATKEFQLENIKRTNSELEQLRWDHDDIDVEWTFPPNGNSLIEGLRIRSKAEKEETLHLEASAAEAKTKMDKQLGRVSTMLGQFKQQFAERELYTFHEDVSKIEAMLEDEVKQLKERKEYLTQEKRRIDKEFTAIQTADIELDRFEEAHHFKNSQIQGRLFTEQEITEIIYQRIGTVKRVTEMLRSRKQMMEAGYEDVTKAKRSFRLFCNNVIKDGKLQKMAIEGIEQKENYQDILTFKKNMTNRLAQADRYAQDYISKNDKDLQAFINSIHNHLLNVTEQLRIIPKKTKVKIEDNWKEIYKFLIPEWTMEDGKQRIREHIDWILNQLDSGRYINETGLEDSGKVRHDIETWLETKQLLQIVLGSETMKVNCRKVTNDNQVTSKFYSWEQSNKWSGGEKWSKNMTLFLGILNFVAEKKQHIDSDMKRHRAVILDNPFGRASSDHVLNPVFFIAEQLGFQIIALTAHAEGKFLQDYFPVLYSCKLRSTLDPLKKVMTKEKNLHQAYFHDHQPESLERLGQVEQMDIFQI